MSGVYLIQKDGASQPMGRVHCKNEDRELQQLLEKNFDLLPGDQIEPEDARRWMLIKREMPVPDPKTGEDRWSVDFLFVDQDAVLTFVECKRFMDTRARREVVGQMLEYAANGHHYWDKDLLMQLAEAAAQRQGRTLDQELRRLLPDREETIEPFFTRMQENLRKGQIRIIFFLEESPMELRSLVDFLNTQMEFTEVLLVEARQYQLDGLSVVVPTLFGYTEEARIVKRSVPGSLASTRRKWTRESFLADLATRVDGAAAAAIERLLDQAVALGCGISWGTGSSRGSFSVIEPAACVRSLYTVYSDGRLNLNFGWLNTDERAERAREHLREVTIKRVGLPVPDDYREKFGRYDASDWVGKAQTLGDAVQEVVLEARKAAK